MTLFPRWNTVTLSTLRFWLFKHHDIRTKLFLESTQNQRYFNVEFDQWTNIDKSTLNIRGYHVDQSRDVISTYTNVETTLGVCWDTFRSSVFQISVNMLLRIHWRLSTILKTSEKMYENVFNTLCIVTKYKS